jgi:hypothetical protein
MSRFLRQHKYINYRGFFTMKPIDFIKEDFVTDAHEAHQDHEVQMARADCYTAAKYAIELHKLLKHISEQQGLDGWVSEKLTLANDYLRTVHEYLTHEQHSQAMPGFDPQVAEMQIESVVNEGALDSLQAIINKIKAMPGIQSYIQAASTKKDALIQALQQSQTGQDLVANIQAAVGGQQAVAEGDLGQKIGGAVSAVASGGLMVASADIFMRAYNAMGKPDLTQMMNDPGGKNAVLLVGWLVVLGALGMLAGANIMKNGMRENKDTLHIPDSDKMSDTERHQAIVAKHPDAVRVGKTPGQYKTKDGKLISGIRGVRKLTKEAGYEHGFADPNAPKLGGGRQNDEPDAVNNIEVSIDGRAWKVFAGRGLDSSPAFFQQKKSVDEMCKRKSRETGKKWTWGVTGKPASVDESAGGMGAGSVASSMGGGNGFLNGGPGTVSRTKAKKAKK